MHVFFSTSPFLLDANHEMDCRTAWLDVHPGTARSLYQGTLFTRGLLYFNSTFLKICLGNQDRSNYNSRFSLYFWWLKGGVFRTSCALCAPLHSATPFSLSFKYKNMSLDKTKQNITTKSP